MLPHELFSRPAIVVMLRREVDHLVKTIVDGITDSLDRHTEIMGDFFRSARFRTNCSARENLGTNFVPFEEPLSAI